MTNKTLEKTVIGLQTPLTLPEVEELFALFAEEGAIDVHYKINIHKTAEGYTGETGIHGFSIDGDLSMPESHAKLESPYNGRATKLIITDLDDNSSSRRMIKTAKQITDAYFAKKS